MNRTLRDPLDALHGALAADALAMPVHWYYDRAALRRDYGQIREYLAPRNPHPDSILWRSSYTPLNAKGDILREQARFWGQRGVHYHQFLAAGENTLNFRLAVELYRQIVANNGYDANLWLSHYTAFLLEPGHHRDTYVEEVHRGFFTRHAQGKKLTDCAVEDIHIGGLAPVPALFAALSEDKHVLDASVGEHISLTHRQKDVQRASKCLTRILTAILEGSGVRQAIEAEGSDWLSPRTAAAWLREPDLKVIGSRVSPACYIQDAFPASLYLAWKYHDDFESGVCANAEVGGDNCHRGAVVGSILGLANGVPLRWVDGLAEPISAPTSDRQTRQ